MFGERPLELGMTGHEGVILGKLREDARYPALVAAAFPDEEAALTTSQAVRALASFQRSLISGTSKRESISGKRTRLAGSAASSLIPVSTNRRA